MAYEQKPGSGSLFKNRNKKDNEKAPDYTGSANIEGVAYKLAAWIKRTKDNAAFMSISIQKKEEEREKVAAPVGDESDVPF